MKYRLPFTVHDHQGEATVSSSRRRRVVAITAVVAAAAGCSATDRPGAAESTSAPTATLSSSVPPPSGAAEPDTSSSSVRDTPAMPDGIAAGTPEAALWEALMGPDGEYMAYAMYGAVIDEFGAVEPYVTIQSQEARHADALTRQLERLGVEVPDNPFVGSVAAPTNLQTAAQAWADGEVANIAMYDRLMAAAEGDAKAIKVFTNLRRSSAQMHLPMFTAAAEHDGTLDDAQMAAFAAQHDELESQMGDHGADAEHAEGGEAGQNGAGDGRADGRRHGVETTTGQG